MTIKVRIFKPARNAMQSGRAGRSEKWMLEGQAATPRVPEHLMGWISADDTHDQIRMTFDCKQAAITFAETKGWIYEVEEPHNRTVHPQSYMSNFEYRVVEYDPKTTGSNIGMQIKKVKDKKSKAKPKRQSSKPSTKGTKSA